MFPRFTKQYVISTQIEFLVREKIMHNIQVNASEDLFSFLIDLLGIAGLLGVILT